ncbi:MAG: ABC transporter ATP-binding protein [Bacteroides sp.]|nr:ABC transporter ATP-binding protein [Bacteroides sp.]
MIQLTNLSYRYPSGISAIDHANAMIGPGIHLLAGENGAGKSTLLRLMAGLLYPSAGEVTIDGRNVALREPDVMNRIFFVSDDMMLPANSVNRLACNIGEFYPHFDRQFLAEALGIFDLDGNARFDRLSLGNRRKTLISFALACGTDIVMLDEPSNGLDLGARRALSTLMMMWTGQKSDRTLIVSTHSVADIESIVDGVIMLRKSNLLLGAECSHILSRICFVKSLVPPEDTLFTMPDTGMFRSITLNDGFSDESDIDLPLLYHGLHSPAAAKILNALT